ncbi:polysaccharide deacetylase family protein [Curvibacter sp. APW13]|uniref:polysaccharide deacetylase family protein n=1 Tax=Curvibacter sp. APW13 TaxID=3077236 RepID=UPI0028DFAE5F|nr:polysaccharide deacetylase family protein [Curvibacter sp. APW13]MDT8991569.1 polysaccharide deacetylase family protein [Curvibacter sp. APW13]
MRDLEPYLISNKPGNVVGITFDDGYQNNLLNALPVLCQNGFTATCYGVSSQIGGTNIWDTGVVAPAALMTREDWKVWSDAGMDIGAHTRTHANLLNLPASKAREEISESRLELQKVLDCEVRHFCYPYGKYLEEHVQMVAEAGYLTATTTRRGRVKNGDDLHRLKRIMVARATNPLQFVLKVASSYEDRRS